MSQLHKLSGTQTIPLSAGYRFSGPSRFRHLLLMVLMAANGVSHSQGNSNDDKSVEVYFQVFGTLDGPSFDAWQQEQFGDETRTEIIGPRAAPAGDGIANLLKYAFGFSAMQPTAPGDFVHLNVEDDLVRLSYLERRDSDLIYFPEVSHDLADREWSTDGIHNLPGGRIRYDDEFDMVTVVASLPHASSRSFFRVSVRQMSPASIDATPSRSIASGSTTQTEGAPPTHSSEPAAFITASGESHCDYCRLQPSAEHDHTEEDQSRLTAVAAEFLRSEQEFSPPSTEEMRALGIRAGLGDLNAIDELQWIRRQLYRNINYDEERTRVYSNLVLMRAAFNPLGEMAGRGSEPAFMALRYSLSKQDLRGFTCNALGIAAGMGHGEALKILLNYNEYGLLLSSTVFALQPAAEKNNPEAVDFLLEVIRNPSHRPLWFGASQGLTGASILGNEEARQALKDYAENR